MLKTKNKMLCTVLCVLATLLFMVAVIPSNILSTSAEETMPFPDNELGISRIGEDTYKVEGVEGTFDSIDTMCLIFDQIEELNTKCVTLMESIDKIAKDIQEKTDSLNLLYQGIEELTQEVPINSKEIAEKEEEILTLENDIGDLRESYDKALTEMESTNNKIDKRYELVNTIIDNRKELSKNDISNSPITILLCVLTGAFLATAVTFAVLYIKKVKRKKL